MRIGVYPGSFNPFHKGHLNILEKAEKMFDKVIIAQGINPEKNLTPNELPKSIQEKYVVREYYGLLTDFIVEVKTKFEPDTNEFKRNFHNVTVIRGLRNSVDLQYEMNQYRYLQDLMPDIQMVSIFCDKEYEHISSSGIRLLSKFGEEKTQKYLVE